MREKSVQRTESIAKWLFPIDSQVLSHEPNSADTYIINNSAICEEMLLMSKDKEGEVGEERETTP